MLYWLASIEVSNHAVKRAQERRVLGSEAEIRAEIRAAIFLDRVSAVRPSWVYGQTATVPKPKAGIFYVWNRDATRCWVIASARGGYALYVRTLVLPPARQAALAADSHLLGSRTR